MLSWSSSIRNGVMKLLSSSGSSKTLGASADQAVAAANEEQQRVMAGGGPLGCTAPQELQRRATFSLLRLQREANIACLPDCAAGRPCFVWLLVCSRWQELPVGDLLQEARQLAHSSSRQLRCCACG